MAVDFDKLNAELLPQIENLLHKWLPDGKKEGKYYSALNPVRGDKNPGSFKVDTTNGIWKDYASGEAGGDLVSLYAYLNHKKQSEAAAELSKKPTAQIRQLPEETILFPAPRGVQIAIPPHPKHGDFTAGPWIYQDHMENIYGIVVRYDTPTGKEVMPLVYSKTKNKWVFKGFPEPRPLYGLQFIKNARQIIVVEGEKCADAARAVLPMTRVVTWQGGGQAALKTNWQPLAEKDVIFWRDNDAPGLATQEVICTHLLKLKCTVRIVNPLALADKPEGWDVADAVQDGWDKEKIADWIKYNLQEFRVTETPGSGARRKNPTLDAGTAPQSPTPTPSILLNKYFKELGMTGNNQYGFYNYTSGMMHKADIKLVYDKKFLTSLTGGDPYYWTTQSQVDAEGKMNVNWAAFAGELVAKCQNMGVFNNAKVRGLGMWNDEGEMVINAGRDFFINNHKAHLYDYDSNFIYTARESVKINVENPLTVAELKSLRSNAAKIRWVDEETSKLFFGWLIAAPLGQTLEWRSHIYLQAASGAGKSWVCQFIRKIYSNFQYGFTMATTAPGVRRKNDNGSVPIIFDEAELKEGDVSSQNLQMIIELARISSRNDGQGITLGKSGGGTEEFTMQNCFCFASIMSSVTQYQDETRITILSLKEKRAETEQETQNFMELEDWFSKLPVDFSARFLGWCATNAELIRKNIAVFRAEGKTVLKSNRFAEQLSMMLGGYYTVEFGRLLTPAEALEILNDGEWLKFVPSQEATSEVRIIDAFNAAQMELEIKDSGYTKAIKRSVRSMVAIMLYKNHPASFPSHDNLLSLIQPGDLSMINADIVEHMLSTIGIKYDPDYRVLAIACTSPQISGMLRGTIWQHKWSSTLKNIPGVFTYEGAQYFKMGRKRALGVPIKAFLDLEDTLQYLAPVVTPEILAEESYG